MGDQFEKRLDSIEKKLDNVTAAITKIAIQKQRIDSLEFKIGSLWNKWDNLIDPNQGVLLTIQSKLSIYDSQVKMVKWILLLFSTTAIGCTVSLFALARYIMSLTP